MTALKTMLMISLGLGTTWLAWEIAPASSSSMLGGVAYAQAAAQDEQVAEQADADIEAQLERIDAALAKEGEVKEFKPSEPLPADMAIEMSSEL